MRNTPCNVCGGTDLNLIDGFYYCIECGTQDTTVQEVVKNADLAGVMTLAGTSKKIRRVKTCINMSSEWYKWHFFNYIIVGLADDLIALGATEIFKKYLLWVWSLYIQRYHNKKLYGNTTKLNKTMKDFLDNGISEDECENLDKLEDAEKLSETLSKDRYNFMTSNLNIITKDVLYSLILIALRLDNSEILASDISRFVNEKRIGNMKKYIPQDLKIKSVPGGMSFLTSVIKSSLFTHNLYVTSTFLNYSLNLPHENQPDYRKLVKKYCRELCLPDDFNDLVISLINYIPVNLAFRFYMAFDYEVFTMAYIVVALKMCFGLDDEYDVKLSSIVDEINEEENRPKAYKNKDQSTDRLFSVSSWLQFLQYRLSVLCTYFQPLSQKYGLCEGKCVVVDAVRDIEEPARLRRRDQVIESLLSEITIDESFDGIPKKEFPATLTPYTTYTDVIISNTYDKKMHLDMNEDFSKYSIKYACVDLELKANHMPENHVTGVTDENKTLNTSIQVKNFAYDTSRYTYTYVKNTDNKDWWKDFCEVKEEEKVKEICDEYIEEIDEDENIFECSTNERVFDDIPIDNISIGNNDDIGNDVNTLESIAIPAFDPNTFNRQEVIKQLVLLKCKKYKIPIPYEFREVKVRERKQRVPVPKTDRVTRSTSAPRQTVSDILKIYTNILNKLKEPTVDNEITEPKDNIDELPDNNELDNNANEVIPENIESNGSTDHDIDDLNEIDTTDADNLLNKMPNDEIDEISVVTPKDDKYCKCGQSYKQKNTNKRGLHKTICELHNLKAKRFKGLKQFIKAEKLGKFGYYCIHYKEHFSAFHDTGNIFYSASLDKMPKSFLYVLHICANLIECKEKDLYAALINLEKAIFLRITPKKIAEVIEPNVSYEFR